LAHVTLHEHAVLVDDRGTAEAPLVFRVVEPAAVEPAQVALPEQLAVTIIAVQPLGPEAGDDVPTVGRRSRVGVRTLHVALHLGHALTGRPLPDDSAGVLV